VTSLGREPAPFRLEGPRRTIAMPRPLRPQLLDNRMRCTVLFYCVAKPEKGGHSSLAAVGDEGHSRSAEIWRECRQSVRTSTMATSAHRRDRQGKSGTSTIRPSTARTRPIAFPRKTSPSPEPRPQPIGRNLDARTPRRPRTSTTRASTNANHVIDQPLHCNSQ
jgi:hypothetical protein